MTELRNLTITLHTSDPGNTAHPATNYARAPGAPWKPLPAPETITWLARIFNVPKRVLRPHRNPRIRRMRTLYAQRRRS